MLPKDTPRVWVIVPLSRPQQLKFVYWQYERLSYLNKSLLIVESKEGKGACLEQGLVPSCLLQNDGTAGECKNLALDYLQDLNESGYWVSMDDDDFYGFDYIEKHLALRCRTQLPLNIGNYEFVVMNDCMVRFKPSPRTVLGASIGGDLPCFERFSKSPVGEEAGLLGNRETVGQGNLPVAVSRLGCPNNHTWKASSNRIWGMHSGGSICEGGNVYDYIEGRRSPLSFEVPHGQGQTLKVELGVPESVEYRI